MQCAAGRPDAAPPIFVFGGCIEGGEGCSARGSFSGEDVPKGDELGFKGRRCHQVLGVWEAPTRTPTPEKMEVWITTAGVVGVWRKCIGELLNEGRVLCPCEPPKHTPCTLQPSRPWPAGGGRGAHVSGHWHWHMLHHTPLIMPLGVGRRGCSPGFNPLQGQDTEVKFAGLLHHWHPPPLPSRVHTRAAGAGSSGGARFEPTAGVGVTCGCMGSRSLPYTVCTQLCPGPPSLPSLPPGVHTSAQSSQHNTAQSPPCLCVPACLVCMPPGRAACCALRLKHSS